MSDPFIGTVVDGKLSVIRLIGHGGMGAVYLAEHQFVRRQVALKILKNDADGEEVVERFRREAEAASRIDSPNVITVHDFGRAESGRPYISMELLDGETLGAVLKRGPLPPREALRISALIAEGLEAAHHVGVVHRDLKPDNVMLVARRGKAPRVKLVDFGVARLLDRQSDAQESQSQSVRMTQAGTLIGTPLYMSPEAARRQPIGPSGDLYALGVILFEMLVGRPPFIEDEAVLLLGLHIRMVPELVREACPELDVSDEVEQLVDSLLSKDPKDRPSSAAELVDRLHALSESASSEVSAPRPTKMAPESMTMELSAVELMGDFAPTRAFRTEELTFETPSFIPPPEDPTPAPSKRQWGKTIAVLLAAAALGFAAIAGWLSREKEELLVVPTPVARPMNVPTVSEETNQREEVAPVAVTMEEPATMTTADVTTMDAPDVSGDRDRGDETTRRETRRSRRSSRSRRQSMQGPEPYERFGPSRMEFDSPMMVTMMGGLADW